MGIDEISFGKGGKLKVSSESANDKGMQFSAVLGDKFGESIFKAFDKDQNNILDEQELSTMRNEILGFAKSWDKDNMGPREAKKFLKKFGIEGTHEDLVKFLNTIGSDKDNVESAVTQNGRTVVTYKPDENGVQKMEVYEFDEETGKSVLVQNGSVNYNEVLSECNEDGTPIKPVNNTPSEGVKLPEEWQGNRLSYQQIDELNLRNAKSVDDVLDKLIGTSSSEKGVWIDISNETDYMINIGRFHEFTPVDKDKLREEIIKYNPSVFNSDGSVKEDADWTKLDLPKSVIEDYEARKKASNGSGGLSRISVLVNKIKGKSENSESDKDVVNRAPEPKPDVSPAILRGRILPSGHFVSDDPAFNYESNIRDILD